MSAKMAMEGACIETEARALEPRRVHWNRGACIGTEARALMLALSGDVTRCFRLHAMKLFLK